MRYLVFGTGSVGGFVGGRLALAGQEVSFLARPRVAEIIKHQGLRVGGDDPGGFLPHPIALTSLEAAFKANSPEFVLLAVKAYDCLEAAQALAEFREHPFTVISLLNGINNERTVEQQIGAGRVGQHGSQGEVIETGAGAQLPQFLGQAYRIAGKV